MPSPRMLAFAALALGTEMMAGPVRTEEPVREALSVQATIPRSGDFMAFGYDSLWMVSGQQLVRINALDNSVVDIAIEGLTGQNRGLAIGEGSVWVADVGASAIHRVDPGTNMLLGTIKTSELRGTEGSIGVGEGSVWVVLAEGHNKVLARYDAETGAELALIALPSTSHGVLVDFGSVWVTGTDKGELYRVDPQTNQVEDTVALRARPRFLTSGEGSVWVLNQIDGTVQRIDGKTGALLATVAAGAAGGGGDIAVGGGFIWATSGTLPVIQIDPATNSLRGAFSAPDKSDMGDAIRYGGGSLWVSGASVFRIEPPR